MTLGEQVCEGVVADVAGEKTAMLEWRGFVRGYGTMNFWFMCPDLNNEPFKYLHKKVRMRLTLETVE